MEDQGLSNSRKYFFRKLKEDIIIHYKIFRLFFIFVMIYKIIIKIPGILVSKKKYDKDFINEKKILL